MMMQLTFENMSVRIIENDGLPYFVAADVCRVLEIHNSSMALGRIDDDEKGISSIDTPGGTQQMQVVTESGLYALILGSRKPEAKAFRRWVTLEVLPQIRQTGGYRVTDDERLVPTDYLSAIKALVTTEENRLALAIVVEAQTQALAAAQPKVDFYDQVVACQDAISIRAAAKLLNIPNLGQIKLFSFLRQQKVLLTNNQPYQEYIDRGWFRVVESQWREHGNVHIYLQTLVYQKGIEGIRRLWESRNNVIRHPGYAIGAPGVMTGQ